MRNYRLDYFQNKCKMNCKLIITDAGDPSVGISPQSWEIECPFTKEYAEDNETQWGYTFKDLIIGVYEEYCDGRCYAEYDFELKNRDTDGE